MYSRTPAIFYASSAVFMGSSLKPNDIITRINGIHASLFQTLFSQGDASTPFRLSYISDGKSLETIIYKQVVTDTSPSPSSVSRHFSARAELQQHQRRIGRTSSADSVHAMSSPFHSSGSAAPDSPRADLQDLHKIAAAVYVPPIAPGQLPVVQMRNPGAIPGARIFTDAAQAEHLPPGCQEFQDAATFKFYYLSPSGQVTWERPTAAAVILQKQQKQKQGQQQQMQQGSRFPGADGHALTSLVQHQQHQQHQQQNPKPPAISSTSLLSQQPSSCFVSGTAGSFMSGTAALVSGVSSAPPFTQPETCFVVAHSVLFCWLSARSGKAGTLHSQHFMDSAEAPTSNALSLFAQFHQHSCGRHCWRRRRRVRP
jgi:hypothetical protein